MSSDYPLQMFLKQLEQLDPNTLAAMYLRGFIIPNYPFIGWFITLGEIAVAIGLLFGRCSRWADLLALWITIDIGLGGYYDASLIQPGLIALLFVVLPTGHWPGLDRRLHQPSPAVDLVQIGVASSDHARGLTRRAADDDYPSRRYCGAASGLGEPLRLRVRSRAARR